MSTKALHLNLLNPLERRSSSPVRARILLPVIATIVTLFVLGWGGFIGAQILLLRIQAADIQAEIKSYSAKYNDVQKLKANFLGLQSEADQFTFYLNGRQKRGELLKRLASAIPESVTLTALSIPPPDEQRLKPPTGSKLPPLQGPTQVVENVELRLTGLAQNEQDIFGLMNALKGNAFTGLVSIVERTQDVKLKSPRIISFRQETPATPDSPPGLFFDIAYRISHRNFAK